MLFASGDYTVVEFPNLGWGPWELNRFLIRDLFGKLSVAWYGAIICTAMILACCLILRYARKFEGMNTESFLDYFLVAIPLGVVGARAMYVLTNLDYYDSFAEAIAVWEGGLAIYGGILTGLLVVFVTSRIKKDSFLKVLDAVVPGLLLAQSIGRWGNFVNGEAHGTVTNLPWAMSINGLGPYHPTFLYESLLTLTGFLILRFVLYPRKKFDGENFCFYLVWYGVGRTAIEGLRTDSLYFGPLRASQVIGVSTAIIGLALLFLLAAAAKRKAALAEGCEGAEATEEKAEPAEPAEEKTEDAKTTETAEKAEEGAAAEAEAENTQAQPEEGNE